MIPRLVHELATLTNACTTPGTWWVFSAAIVVGLLCIVLRALGFARRLGTDRAARAGLVTGVALFLVALLLRLWLPERVHYTFNDEYEYLDHAQRLLASHAYTLWAGPPAGVYLFALAFAAFGASSAVAFVATIVLASLTPPVFCWTLGVLRVPRAVAVLAAVLLALAPLHVKHAASASIEVPSLLAVLLALGTFLQLLRAPGALAAACFATSLFFALTMRVENWALVVLLPLAAWLWRDEARPLRPAHLVPAGVALLLAAIFLPGILDAPIRYAAWWKTRLPLPALVLANAGFWVGGDALLRKLPLLLGVIGVLAAARRSRRVMVLCGAWLVLYSLVLVAYGLNVGWVAEAHQPPPWGARAGGHDVFRFNLTLLPPVAFVLASGGVAVARGVMALLRGTGRGAAWSPAARVAALGASAALLLALAAWRGEWRSYHPLAFVASPYNRGFEVTEFRFLRDVLGRRASRDAALYVLPPSEGIWVDGLAARPLASLDADARVAGPAWFPMVYVNGRQLAVPELRDAFAAAQLRHRLRQIDHRVDGGDRFFLLTPAPSAGTAVDGPGS